MATRWRKDPDEVLDFKISWAVDEYGNPGRAAEDDLVASEWIVPDGLTVDSASFDAVSATIWLSGGTLNETYLLTNRIKTAGDRTMDQSVKLRIKSN